MKSIIRLLIIRLRQMLGTLKRLNHHYDSFTIESFFGSKLGRLLYLSLGLRTVRDLVNVDAEILVDAMLDLSELDGREFSEVFQALYEFFESY